MARAGASCGIRARVGVSLTTVKLLAAASEIVGDYKTLADRLGVGEVLLGDFLADRLELPDSLLLRAVDIILEDRAAGTIATSRKNWQNSGHGSGTPPEPGTAP